MTTGGRERTRRRPNKYPKERRLDGDPGKRFPNSLAATVRAIRRLWNVPPEISPRTTGEFEPIIQEYFQRVVELYPAEQDQATDIDQWVERLESGDCEATYYHIRTYSEYVDIPIGLLFIYSHLIGDAAKGQSKEELLQFLLSCEAGITALRENLVNSKDTQGGLLKFKPRSPMPAPYNASVSGLSEMQMAYKRTRSVD